MNTKKLRDTYEGKKVYTISIAKANLVALILIIPILAILGLPYYLIWGGNIMDQVNFSSAGLFLLFIVLGIVIHELLHGITWAFFTKNGFRSISFGVKWEFFTPYCHCSEPLRVWQYIVGGLMPLLIMGLVPWVYAMIEGNAQAVFFGIFFSIAAGGDIQSVWLLRKFKSSQLIYDHPETLGFILEDDE